ncbi:phage terminase large subunit [Sphingobium sp. WTD-1]|uniref:phage terminase large subunit n=1 Tax=Sphingobium sp. WTD-1 TaxID=2979467 RepID=UPI0024DE7970|nr:phage terminase large subunit [Sphingobium sp. WTD-1]WIA56008.1 phage terminase large subunit [Sphingobium sp. WTD-1]
MATIKTASQIRLTSSQKQAALLASNPSNRYILYRGGSRSGKSYLLSYILLMRAISTPGSRHGIFRKTASSCRQTLFDLTFRQVMEDTFPGILSTCLISDSEATITLPNGPDPKNPYIGGAIFLFLGLDDGRRDKILGNEFATVWINECTEVDYDHVSFLMTRLNQKLPQIRNDELGQPIYLKPKMFFDCNPALKTDWEYKAFIQKINPKDNTELQKAWQWAEAKLDPEGNSDNIDPDYLDMLNNLSVREKRRFVAGEWSDVNENALFRQDDIDKHRRDIDISHLQRIVIAVDPAVTNHKKSDLTGISVAGRCSRGDIYVLHDGSDKLPPAGWADRVAELYEQYQADLVIAEANQGGDLVQSNLRSAYGALPVKLVRAFRGKELRAEPVAHLYAQGKVHHPRRPLTDLEEQMGMFGAAAFKGSPDRVDALVYAITELADLNGNGPRPGAIIINAGNRRR